MTKRLRPAPCPPSSPPRPWSPPAAAAARQHGTPRLERGCQLGGSWRHVGSAGDPEAQPRGATAAASTAAATTAPAKVTTGALHIPFFDDMGVPDPDVFYGAEGLMVTNGVYDSLLQYGPDSFKVEGDVAALPKVSTDGLTYTFTLHAGITFHDGTRAQLRRGRRELRQADGAQPGTVVHAGAGRLGRHPRPDHAGRAHEDAGQRIPRLPRLAVEPQDPEPDGASRPTPSATTTRRSGWARTTPAAARTRSRPSSSARSTC